MSEINKDFWINGGESNIEIEPTIPVPMKRYDKLIESEIELRLLKKALTESDTSYISINDIKRVFGLEKSERNNINLD